MKFSTLQHIGMNYIAIEITFEVNTLIHLSLKLLPCHAWRTSKLWDVCGWAEGSVKSHCPNSALYKLKHWCGGEGGQWNGTQVAHISNPSPTTPHLSPHHSFHHTHMKKHQERRACFHHIANQLRPCENQRRTHALSCCTLATLFHCSNNTNENLAEIDESMFWLRMVMPSKRSDLFTHRKGFVTLPRKDKFIWKHAAPHSARLTTKFSYAVRLSVASLHTILSNHQQFVLSKNSFALVFLTQIL